MLSGENIICFAKDWDDDPTSNTHVMRLLSRSNRVLWLNSIAMRTPKLTSGVDIFRIGRRLRSVFRGARQVDRNLWVLSPLVLPLPHSQIAVALNRMILRMTLWWTRRQLGMREFQLWTFLPSAIEYVGTLGESLAIYYCTDDWLHAAGYDGAKLRTMEYRLGANTDMVFATASPLQEIFSKVNSETHLARHGVDQVHFAKALLPATPIAAELEELQRPILGVIGFIDERVDVELIAKLAAANPAWTVAIVGKIHVNVSELEKYPNIKFLGRKPYERLPEFCKGFSVGLIPFLVNEYTRHVNPIKLREYLSAGLPVVSTNLPEVGIYRGICRVASTHDEFVAGVMAALEDNSLEARAQRSEKMRTETWESKVDELTTQVARVMDLRIKVKGQKRSI